MNNWEEDTLASFCSKANEAELFLAIAESAKRIGFDFCSYGAMTPIPINKPKLILLDNYSQSWRDQYSSNNYIAIDPTVRHGLRSSSSLIWTPDRGDKSFSMWESANDHGLRHGWAQSSRDGNSMVGMLTLARSYEDISSRELHANEAKMTWLVQISHSAMASILTPRLLPEALIYLTSRENEVLKWTAEGKTAFEIGIILSISVPTVNFHVNNFVAKLGSSNKIQAVVKAALCGLLN
jgi:LuxR family quorum-sensing system transcriptional regulator SolR